MSDLRYEVRCQFFATDRQVDAIKLIASENDMTFSAVMRMAMMQFLRANGATLPQPRPNGQQRTIGADHGQ